MGLIAVNLQENLSFLDISYCKQVSDLGLEKFKEKTYPLDSLVINGCNGISGPGLNVWLHSFKDTLLDLEAALMDQESFNSKFFETLGFCFNLETLDVSGSNGMDDDGVRMIFNAEVKSGIESVKPGLQQCHTLKIGGATISDATIPSLLKVMPNLEHVELIKCEGISDFGFQQFLQTCPNLKFIDIAKVPIVMTNTYGFLDELK